MKIDALNDAKILAFRFTEALVNRDYPAAYEMTAASYRQVTTIEAMRAAFELMIPLSWVIPRDWEGIKPIEVIEPVVDIWRDKPASDVAWVYVSIAGMVYSEAVNALIAYEDEQLVIREVNFGRP